MLSRIERQTLCAGYAMFDGQWVSRVSIGLAAVVAIAAAGALRGHDGGVVGAEARGRLAVEQSGIAHARDVFRQRQINAFRSNVAGPNQRAANGAG